MIIWDILLLSAGFALLIKGADLLVSGASSIAANYGVSQLVIGLTVVSFGTSTPELAVNLIASFQGNSGITIGNVVGSNIANILLILGISAIIYPLGCQRNTVWREIPFAFLAALVLLVMAADSFFNAGESLISRGDGIILLLFFIIFLIYVFGIMKEGDEPNVPSEKLSKGKSIFFVISGLAGLVLGGNFIVDSAVSIARMFSISEAVIGFTIVAVGTSLPELAASAVAAYRKNADIALGNIVGSNIFNIFLILGLSAVVNPIPSGSELNFDFIFLTIVSALLFLFMFTGGKRTVDRWEGIVFVILYGLYITRFIV